MLWHWKGTKEHVVVLLTQKQTLPSLTVPSFLWGFFRNHPHIYDQTDALKKISLIQTGALRFSTLSLYLAQGTHSVVTQSNGAGAGMRGCLPQIETARFAPISSGCRTRNQGCVKYTSIVTEQGRGGSFTINYYRKDSAFLFLEVPSPTPPPARFAMPAARGRTSLNARDWWKGKELFI